MADPLDRLQAPLHERMRKLAPVHPRGAELTAAADTLEKALAPADEADTERNIKRMLGCWARARRLWHECTGEPLV